MSAQGIGAPEAQRRSRAIDGSALLPSRGRTPECACRKKRIYIGEVVASAKPMVLQTLLGSCVAVCLRDPVSMVGGMNHILLPGRSRGVSQSARWGVHAMELLINAIMRRGGDRRNLVAKAFGAANVVPGLQAPTVGDRNARFVREFLAIEKIPLLAQRLGGTQAVQVHFKTDTGQVALHSMNGSRLPALLRAKENFIVGPFSSEFDAGEVTLF